MKYLSLQTGPKLDEVGQETDAIMKLRMSEIDEDNLIATQEQPKVFTDRFVISKSNDFVC
jgi:hypothetical protein